MKQEKWSVFERAKIHAGRMTGQTLAIKNIAFAGDEDKLLLIERLHLDSRKRFSAVYRKKDEIDPSLSQCFGQFVSAVGQNRHFDTRITL